MFVYSLDGLKIDGDLPPDQEIEENEITARSGVYQIFGQLFTLPDEDAHRTAVEGKWPEKLRGAAELLAFDFDFGVAALASSVSAYDYQAEYNRLFDVGGGTAIPLAPICSGVYGDGDRTKRTEEVVRVFEYFGLQTSADQARSPDHLATEMEFMQYLSFKEAASSSPRLSSSFRRAQEDFLDRQLTTWLPDFATRVEREDALPIWVWASQTVSEFAKADAQYLKS
jgi:DMSO reductase family type II enzyme chaperone|tara:strand:- start:120 stop:797 length:678 start_codon:yes stop_codon:yes gene_type:complete